MIIKAVYTITGAPRVEEIPGTSIAVVRFPIEGDISHPPLGMIRMSGTLTLDHDAVREDGHHVRIDGHGSSWFLAESGLASRGQGHVTGSFDRKTSRGSVTINLEDNLNIM